MKLKMKVMIVAVVLSLFLLTGCTENAKKDQTWDEQLLEKCPGYHELYKTLTGYRGSGMQLRYNPEYGRISSEGKFFPEGTYTYSKLIYGEPNLCFVNSCHLYLDTNETLTLCIGYYIYEGSDDWIMHAWCMENNTIYETTQQGTVLMYYGVDLNRVEARFLCLNIGAYRPIYRE
jgi:hypothetical protein